MSRAVLRICLGIGWRLISPRKLSRIIHELVSVLEAQSASTKPKPGDLGELIDLVEAKQLTGSVAKRVLGELVADPPPDDLKRTSPGKSLHEILSARGELSLGQEELRQLCADAIESLPKEVELVKQGKTKVLMRIVGEVMKRAKGRADAEAALRLLRAELGVPEHV